MTIPPKKVVNADAGDADHVGGIIKKNKP
jgi:hypothetical protein